MKEPKSMSIVHYASQIQQNNYTYKQMIPFSLFACGIYLPPKKQSPWPTDPHMSTVTVAWVFQRISMCKWPYQLWRASVWSANCCSLVRYMNDLKDYVTRVWWYNLIMNAMHEYTWNPCHLFTMYMQKFENSYAFRWDYLLCRLVSVPCYSLCLRKDNAHLIFTLGGRYNLFPWNVHDKCK